MRHFAYYRQADGAYVGEQRVPIDVPARLASMPEPRRARVLARWLNRVARPMAGILAVDVSRFDYPLGDFCFSVLRFGDGDDGRPLLDFPTRHTFLEIDRRSLTVVAWVRSARPIRSTAQLWVVDVTAMGQRAFGVFDWLQRRGALTEAAPALDPMMARDRVSVEV